MSIILPEESSRSKWLAARVVVLATPANSSSTAARAATALLETEIALLVIFPAIPTNPQEGAADGTFSGMDRRN
ncbi:hypothetical protein E2562_034669, partial [Oryza meyeriana var. granulata]